MPPRPKDVPQAVAAIMEVHNGETGQITEFEVQDDA